MGAPLGPRVRGAGRGGRGRGRGRKRLRRRELPPHMASAGRRAEVALATRCLGILGRGARRDPDGRQGRGGIHGPDSRRRRRRRLRPMLVDFPGCTSRPLRPASPLRRPALAARGPSARGLRRHRPPLGGQRDCKAQGLPSPAGSGAWRGARQRWPVGGGLPAAGRPEESCPRRAAPRVGRGRASARCARGRGS